MRVVRKQTEAGKTFDKAMKDLSKNEKVAKVGWFKGAKYPDGTQVAYVATIQEYGYAPKNIPPRPMMRPTIAKRQTAWREMMQKFAKDIIAGKRSTESVLDLIGQKAAGDLRETITQISEPALELNTIYARSRKRKDRTITESLTKPLVDTGKLLNSATSVVENE